MKKMIYLSILIVVIITVTAIIATSNEKTETQKYNVVFKENNFEIRYYPMAIMATVEMKGDFYESRNSGFNVLAGYIFGGNRENQKIAMTSPVRMTGEEENSKMSFVLPSEMTYDNLPEPINKDIILHQTRPVYMASMRFGGFAGKNEIMEHKEKLVQVLTELGLSHSDKFEYLGYNPPYQMINRRNEVQIELVNFNQELFSEYINSKKK